MSFLSKQVYSHPNEVMDVLRLGYMILWAGLLLDNRKAIDVKRVGIVD